MNEKKKHKNKKNETLPQIKGDKGEPRRMLQYRVEKSIIPDMQYPKKKREN